MKSDSASFGALDSGLDGLAAALADGEQFESLFEGRCGRVERIVSQGQHSPADFWYDQSEHEFVLLVQGAAEVEFEDGSVRRLRAGSWLNIPPHVRHRVTWTAPLEVTVWLAVFFASE